MVNHEYYAQKEGTELATELESRIEKWTEACESVGIKELWSKSYRYYYGNHFKTEVFGASGDIKSLGDEGELKAFKVNNYRNLIRHILTMTTSQRPVWDCRAINSDPKSLNEAQLGNNILDYYMTKKRAGKKMRQAAEVALVLAQGYVHVEWNTSLGKQYGVKDVLDENGEPVLDEDGKPVQKIQYEGDLEFKYKTPMDVWKDPGVEDWDKLNDIVVTEYHNRHDLAARYPHLADDILSIETKQTENQWSSSLFTNVIDETEVVAVHKYYHNRTDALPSGRHMIFCDGGIVLYDGAMPYRKIPVFRISPSDIFASTEGYSDAFDLLEIQDALNVLYSTYFTNLQAFGVQAIWMPDGVDLSSEEISKGMVVLKGGNPDRAPQPLQLCKPPEGLLDFAQLLKTDQETISGVNSVARGNPEHSLKSGVALSLVQSMAVQYQSAFQESWVQLLEDVGTFAIEVLQDFATTERLIDIGGKFNRGAITAFTGDKLRQISRVMVDLGNPMARTAAGRAEMASEFLERGLIKSPEQYIEVIKTGQIESMTQGPMSKPILIKRENEAMMEGRPAPVLISDAHLLHMQEHQALLDSPEVRQDPQLTQLVLSHIEEHKQLYKTQDPMWAIINGEQPAPQPPPMQGPGAGPQSGPMPPRPEPMAPAPPLDPNTPPPMPPGLEPGA